jgi:hypothetical protein
MLSLIRFLYLVRMHYYIFTRYTYLKNYYRFKEGRRVIYLPGFKNYSLRIELSRLDTKWRSIICSHLDNDRDSAVLSVKLQSPAVFAIHVCSFHKIWPILIESLKALQEKDLSQKLQRERL